MVTQTVQLTPAASCEPAIGDVAKGVWNMSLLFIAVGVISGRRQADMRRSTAVGRRLELASCKVVEPNIYGANTDVWMKV